MLPTIEKNPDWPPLCPNCGTQLTLFPEIDASGPSIKGFWCSPCGHIFIWDKDKQRLVSSQ